MREQTVERGGLFAVENVLESQVLILVVCAAYESQCPLPRLFVLLVSGLLEFIDKWTVVDFLAGQERGDAPLPKEIDFLSAQRIVGGFHQSVNRHPYFVEEWFVEWIRQSDEFGSLIQRYVLQVVQPASPLEPGRYLTVRGLGGDSEVLS